MSKQSPRHKTAHEEENKVLVFRSQLPIYVAFLRSALLVWLIVSIVVASSILLVYYWLTSRKDQIKVAVPRTSVNSVNIDALESDVGLYIDPNDLLGRLQKGVDDFILVDVRSKEGFDKGHIKGAVNIPLSFEDKAVVDDTVLDLIEKNSKNKQIIIYGDSAYSQPARVLGLHLMKKHINAYILRIGWNEWDHIQTLWINSSDWGNADTRKYSVYE